MLNDQKHIGNKSINQSLILFDYIVKRELLTIKRIQSSRVINDLDGHNNKSP